MALVFGIGAGLFTLAIIWGFSLLMSIILSRASGGAKYGGIALVVLAGLITVILIIYPKEGVNPEPDTRITDRMFWPRIIILTVISIFALLCLVFMFIFHWTEPIYAKPIKSRRF
ncbi:transmembrane protein 218-like [Acanthaster planci]|uniref:Transmembrane protein 218 n=1 Tax=Acanthaster planci TaxID=133434 RepID=A0A8B7ZBW8_ACAPL|nr:transmembrane protein 218-like [Acanthaster planci]XP_022103158.1 transmembrane protein 218-like [Acanthaster planci]